MFHSAEDSRPHQQHRIQQDGKIRRPERKNHRNSFENTYEANLKTNKLRHDEGEGDKDGVGELSSTLNTL